MIVGNMATYPPRRETVVEIARALAVQVDRLNLVLNEYDAPLLELADVANLRQIVPDRDLKDVGKFFPDSSDADFVFLLDDDIVYPPNYVAASLAKIAKMGERRAVNGYHASSYLRPRLALRMKQIRRWLDWQRSRPDLVRHVNFFERALEHATFVDQLGTGTVVCRGSDMPPLTYMQGSAKFVDVRFANWCLEQGLDQIALPRVDGWMTAIRHDETIFEDFTKQTPMQVSREILRFAGKRPQIGRAVS